MSIPRGALPAQALEALHREGGLLRPGGLDPDRVQPASLDLTLSAEAWRLPASVLPMADEPVRAVIERFARRPVDLSRPEVLDRNKVHLVRLEEALALPPGIGAYANSKSSIGRIDLQTRVLTDRNPRFDKIQRGYQGELFLEIVPKSFDVAIQAGLSLNQVILYGRRGVLPTQDLERVMQQEPLLYDRRGRPFRPEECWIDDGLLLSVDLDQEVVGWVARQTTEELELREDAANDPLAFFEPVPRPRNGRLQLRRGSFYILSTREFIRVPPRFAVEMLPYETTAGEFRAHYAGFFDPGFGWTPDGKGLGTPAVLEVRSYDDDLILRHGQPICKVAYEVLAETPSKLYGGSRNHYHDQRGPRLSRFFSAV